MDLKEIIERLHAVKTNIGTVRFNRNLSAICTGNFALASSLNIPTLINRPSSNTITTSCLFLLCASWCGWAWYLEQKELNELRKEESDLKNEEIKQLTLVR